jgi:hypothetical protein
MSKILEYIAKAKKIVLSARKAAVAIVGILLVVYGPDGHVAGIGVDQIILVLTALGVYATPNPK